MKNAGAVVLGIAALAAIPALAHDDEGSRFGGNLVGYQENPTLSTPGNGRFDMSIDERRGEVHWQLSYADLESTVTQAHIHIGRPAINGNIFVFLCTNLGNAPVPPAQPTQACPPAPATISGTFTAADIIQTTQGISAGEFEEALAAIRNRAAYANVHTTGRPGGEIRAQLRRGHSHGGD